MKFKIKEFTRKYSSEKKKKDVAERSDLERKFKNLSQILNANSSDETRKEYEDCKNRLESFYDNITKGLILRSKAEWYEKGEKSNKYFYNLEKSNKSKTHVRSLINDNTETHDQVTIMRKLNTYYSSLYTRKSIMTEKECLDYFADINSPILTNEGQHLCEGQLTPVEVFDALSNMQSNKTPGNDCLSKEFYLAFFDILCPNLLKCLNYTFEVGEPSTSQRQAVITLIEKKGKDKCYIKNWRPISLLNVDAKILSKILVSCVKKVISSLITSDQTAYVLGRVIVESIRLTSDLTEYSNIQNIPGYLMTMDTEKALTRLTILFFVLFFKNLVLEKNFIRWVSIILNRQESCVMNDGHSTGYFSLLSGTRQGDPISAYLFILVMEILFIQIRSNENIHGLKFFGYEFKLSAFADDVSYFFKDINFVKELLKLLEQSSKFTSLKVNYDKSEICGIGSKKGAIGAFSQFRIVNLINYSVKILGCHHSYNSQLANDRNFCDTIKKFQVY